MDEASQDRIKLKLAKASLHEEKVVKKKLYGALTKIADELKATKAENALLRSESGLNGSIIQQEVGNGTYQRSNSSGGRQSGVKLLPSIQERLQSDIGTQIDEYPSQTASHKETSLSDLFFDSIIAISFIMVGKNFRKPETSTPWSFLNVDLHSFTYFLIFWFIWVKEVSYQARFDGTDLWSQMVTLITCFAIIFGSTSVNSIPGVDDSAFNIMATAGLVSLMHLLLYCRVWVSFKDSGLHDVIRYARHSMMMGFCESTIWWVGVLCGQSSQWFWCLGILFSIRIPWILEDDFQVACSRRGVLFILLLGFTLQSVVLVASSFFSVETPRVDQYIFLGLTCFLLFCIKLLYVHSSVYVAPTHFSLQLSGFAGFLFHTSWLGLNLFLIILGSGLNNLTSTYLAATTALSDNSLTLVCGGFLGVIVSIGVMNALVSVTVARINDEAKDPTIQQIYQDQISQSSPLLGDTKPHATVSYTT